MAVVDAPLFIITYAGRSRLALLSLRVAVPVDCPYASRALGAVSDGCPIRSASNNGVALSEAMTLWVPRHTPSCPFMYLLTFFVGPFSRATLSLFCLLVEHTLFHTPKP